MTITDRRSELAASLADLDARIARACDAAGRDRATVCLIAVTKTFPASDIRLLADLGVTDVGENRDEEAAGKYADCADLPLAWHFVGQLQRRKARSVASYADVVHSIDRPELATALGAAAVGAGRVVAGLVQVSLDPPGADGRAGVAPEAVVELAGQVQATEGLALTGVMAVAPLGGDPDVAFGALSAAATQVRTAFPAATVISAGMSGDLEAAIRHGATHLRVGTALLGGRGQLVG
jgi:hypothetical protein